MRNIANMRDDLFHAIKLPTKVLVGVALAIPLTWVIVIPKWWIVNQNPVNTLLSYLPSIVTTSETDLTPSPSPTNSTPASSSVRQWQPIDSKTLNFVSLLLMTGTLGGAVSILFRLKDFDNRETQKYEDDFLPFFISLIKPILGGSFAFFIFLLLNSEVSPVKIRGEETTSYFYGLLALAFIAGFSKRFVPDLISQSEKPYVTSFEC